MTMFIPSYKLRHHPNNPRKEIGDISELADSIKAQGLIQPLVVVPDDNSDDYFVVAGNRRLEACKEAGLDTIECIVATLSDDEAIGVMMTENMLRQNLSSIEENEGFQLMLDMGKTEEEIGKKTGLKAETVKLRTKLSKLDKDNLKKACESGATLFELAAVADIEDEKEREKLLKKAGTRDFNNALERMKQEKEIAQRMINIEQFMRDHEFEEYNKTSYEDGFPCVELVDEDGTVLAKMSYLKNVASYRTYNKDEPDESMFDPDTKYYFVKTSWAIEVYRDATPEEYETEKSRKEARTRYEEEESKTYALIKEIEERHKTLRKQFVLNYADFKKHQAGLKKLIEAALDKFYNGGSTFCLKDNLEKLELSQATKSNDYQLLIKSYVVLDAGSFIDRNWNPEAHKYELVHRNCESLSKLYECLVELGYQVSEEEEQIMNGTHPIFEKKEEVTEDVA